MRVVGYVRVSTDEQGRSGLGLEAQVESITRAHPEAEIITEVASGKSLDGRPALAAALDGMRRGDKLVVAKLDRLSRSLADFAGLVERAARGGWSVTALDVGVDTSTPAGEMIVNVMATFARYERRLISERTRAASLVRLGRDPVWVATQERVLGLRAEGLTVAAIKRETGLHRETINRVLRRA